MFITYIPFLSLFVPVPFSTVLGVLLVIPQRAAHVHNKQGGVLPHCLQRERGHARWVTAQADLEKEIQA